ncbi:hypothetical protein EJB05_47080, partial [Eragrostis curvula]
MKTPFTCRWVFTVFKKKKVDPTACTNPNPTDRPSTAELVQIIAKRIAPPDLTLVKPTFLELPLLDDLDLNEDDEDPDYSNPGTLSRDGFALSIGSLSLEIM